jgi:transcriptional regulator with XRE-family HTH domain
MQMHERVKQYISDRGLSQKIIAANMGIPEPKLSLILNGKRRMTVDDYELICRAMAVDPARFYHAAAGSGK